MAKIVDIRRKNGQKGGRKGQNGSKSAQNGSEPPKPPFKPRPVKRKPLEGTLEYMFENLPHKIRGAIIFAAYSPLADERITALYDAYKAAGEPTQYDIDAACQKVKLRPAEFVGIVCGGMSQVSADTSAILKALKTPLIVEASLDRAIEGERYEEVSDWLVATGHHAAPKAAQFNINSGNQALILNAGEAMGLPSFEDSVGGDIERATRRALPESSAVPIDTNDTIIEGEFVHAGTNKGSD